MRTTLTIDPDVAAALQEEMVRRGGSFKSVVNDTLRRGLGLKRRNAVSRYRLQPHSSPFRPGVDPARLNQLIDDLEADEWPGREKR